MHSVDMERYIHSAPYLFSHELADQIDMPIVFLIDHDYDKQLDIRHSLHHNEFWVLANHTHYYQRCRPSSEISPKTSNLTAADYGQTCCAVSTAFGQQKSHSGCFRNQSDYNLKYEVVKRHYCREYGAIWGRIMQEPADELQKTFTDRVSWMLLSTSCPHHNTRFFQLQSLPSVLAIRRSKSL